MLRLLFALITALSNVSWGRRRDDRCKILRQAGPCALLLVPTLHEAASSTAPVTTRQIGSWSCSSRPSITPTAKCQPRPTKRSRRAIRGQILQRKYQRKRLRRSLRLPHASRSEILRRAVPAPNIAGISARHPVTLPIPCGRQRPNSRPYRLAFAVGPCPRRAPWSIT
jgi:hypothetical protein